MVSYYIVLPCSITIMIVLYHMLNCYIKFYHSNSNFEPSSSAGCRTVLAAYSVCQPTKMAFKRISRAL